MNLKSIFLLIAVLSASACAISIPKQVQPLGASEQQAEQFEDELEAVVSAATRNTQLPQLELNTGDNQRWFIQLSYRHWSGELDKAAFVAEGVQRFPDCQETFEFLADEL